MKQEHKDLIKELSVLLRENNLHEIEYQENGVLLKVVAEGIVQSVPVASPKSSTESKEVSDNISLRHFLTDLFPD